jgi:hypothetical protein
MSRTSYEPRRLSGEKGDAPTVSELAAVLSISERQIYSLAARTGYLVSRSGSIRFDPSTVAGWLRKKMVPAVGR